MVKIKKIGASTLPEVIISMMIAIFMFGFIAWTLVKIDQRKSIKKDTGLFAFQLNAQNAHVIDDLCSFKSNEYSFEISETPSSLDENLTERTFEIKNKNMKVIYSFKLLKLRDNDENNLSY